MDKPHTNFDVRFNLNVRIKGLEYDIQTLKAVGKERDQKYIDNLTKVLADYNELLAKVPDNDEPYVRPE